MCSKVKKHYSVGRQMCPLTPAGGGIGVYDQFVYFNPQKRYPDSTSDRLEVFGGSGLESCVFSFFGPYK